MNYRESHVKAAGFKEFPKDFKKVRFGSAQASAEWQKALEGIGA